MSLIKDISTKYTPGTSGTPGSSGHPAIPAYCETTSVSQCSWIPNPDITYQNETFYYDCYPDGIHFVANGCSAIRQVPYYKGVKIVGGGVPMMVYQCAVVPVTTCHPAQAAVPAIPAIPATPAQRAVNLNYGWNNGRAQSIGVITEGQAVRVSVDPSSMGVFVGIDGHLNNLKPIGSFSHGLMFDSNGVRVYENGTFVSTLASSFTSTNEFLVSRQTTGSVVYSLSGVTSYTSTTNTTGVMYAYASLYAGGDTIISAGIEYTLTDAVVASFPSIQVILSEDAYEEVRGIFPTIVAYASDPSEGALINAIFPTIQVQGSEYDYSEIRSAFPLITISLNDEYVPPVPDGVYASFPTIQVTALDFTPTTDSVTATFPTIQVVASEYDYSEVRAYFPTIMVNIAEETNTSLLWLTSALEIFSSYTLRKDSYEQIADTAQSVISLILNSSISADIGEICASSDILKACFTQLVTDSSAASELWFLEIGPTLVDMILATGQVTTQLAATQTVAELVVALDLYQKGLLENIVDYAAATIVTAQQSSLAYAQEDTVQTSDTSVSIRGVYATAIDSVTALDVATAQTDAVGIVDDGIRSSDTLTAGIQQSVVETVLSEESIALQVYAVQQILEQASASEFTSSYVVVYNNVDDTASATDTMSPWQQLSVSVTDGAAAFIKLNIGGDVYTGWVLNAQAGAVSEYQGLSFNSMAKVGGRYFGATDTGIMELTGEQDSGKDISIYIQGGILDFGTSQLKSMTYGYLATDSSGRIALGIAVSEKAGAVMDWYEVAMDEEAIGNVKLPIGRGYRGRYWKFSVAGERMKSFESITLLPVVLSRRV